MRAIDSTLLLHSMIAGSYCCFAFTSISSASMVNSLSKPKLQFTSMCYPSIKSINNRGLGSALLAAPDSLVAEDLSKLTVPQLKDKLRGLNLTVGGRKNELIDRLNEHYESREVSAIQEAVDEVESYDLGEDGDTEKDGSEEGLQLQTSSSNGIEGGEEDLNKLTVSALKERLRDLGHPVGGRKAELIERLQEAAKQDDEGDGASEDEVDDTDQEIMSILDGILDVADEDEDEDDDFQQNMASLNMARGNDEGSAGSKLMDILDDILDDVEEEDGSDEIQLPSLDNEDNGSSIIESASTRKAKRKKYWKTQEVKELISANDPQASVKAEEMIASLEQMAAEEEVDEYLPGPVQYTMLIDAYAKSGTPDSIQRAEAVIDEIFEKADKGNAITPSPQMLNSVMGGYANIGNAEAAEKATALLERMEYLKEFGGTVKPTVHSYSIAISAWTKCGSEAAAENAENILNRLFEDYDQVFGSEDGDQSRYARELKPNNIVLNSVIDAWARSGSPEAGERAEKLLDKMEVLSHMDKYDVRPDTISFNTCIKAWCNSERKDAPLKAEEVLAKLETNPSYPKRNGGALTVRPNRLSYNTVINAWAKSGMEESAMRAEGILLRMIKSFKSETFATITPDSVTFASVLNALAKSKTVRFKAEKCSSILKAMIELHEDDGSYDTRPNIICFNTVLNACAFSAQAKKEEQRRALAVAVETFNLMRQGKYVSPDAVSYGNMLKCCANLMPTGDQRNGMASRLFASCCDDGLVGGMCLDEIRRCLPNRALFPLLADCGYGKPLREGRKAYSVQLRELPREWTKNVKRGDMVSRQRGSFKEPRKRPERRTQQRRRQEKPAPVIRRPGRVIEYGASSKEL